MHASLIVINYYQRNNFIRYFVVVLCSFIYLYENELNYKLNAVSVVAQNHTPPFQIAA